MLILSLSESICLLHCLLHHSMDSQLSSQVYFTPSGSPKMRLSAVSDHTWSGQGPGLTLGWPSEAPSSLSVLWCPWRCFKAPSCCWMHVCSSYIRTLSLQGHNKIKLGHGIMCILIILSSVWARLEFRIIFLELCWLYSIRKENLTLYNQVNSYKSKYK